MRFPFFRNRDSVKNGILISIRRTGDGFHPGLFKLQERMNGKKTIRRISSHIGMVDVRRMLDEGDAEWVL